MNGGLGRRVFAPCLLLVGLVAAAGRPSWGAAPVISAVSPNGLTTGGQTTLSIAGSGLSAKARLLAPFPIAQQTIREGGTAGAIAIDVTLDASVPAGVYPLWLATEEGLSGPIALGIDRLPNLPFAPEIASLPVALSGQLQGATVLKTSFQGSTGQAIVIEVEGKRFGQEFNPYLHLYDAQGIQLAWAQAQTSLQGDARIVATLPTAGKYTVEMHDGLYRGPGPGSFRLKIGEFRCADYVFPLAVRSGASARLELLGAQLAGGTSIDLLADPTVGERLVPWPTDATFSGVRPRVIQSEIDEIAELDPAAGGATPQVIASVPSAVNGRLSQPGEQDRFQWSVTPGQSLRFDVLASRAGTPLDGVLTLKNAMGSVLAESDDRPGTVDPGLDFVVPAGVDSIVATVSDRQDRGGLAYVYRLSVAPTSRPNFALRSLADRWEVPSAGTTTFRVRAERADFNGAIRLNFPNLPAGMSVTGAEIPAGATDALVSISASETCEALALLEPVGESLDPAIPIRRSLTMAETPFSKLQGWIRRQAPIASVDSPPISIHWRTESSGLSAPLAAAIPAQIELARRGGVAGAVRLSLLTSQVVPKKTVMENNQNKEVDDLDRALRFDGQPMIAADQSIGMANILVPGDLADIPYDMAIKAELLSADQSAVIAQVVTPSRRFRVSRPFRLKLQGLASVEAKAGGGETGKLTGVAERSPGFNRPITLSLVGLAAELPTPSVEIAGDQSEFALPVAFPFGTSPGALENVRLVATSQLTPQIATRSDEIPVAVTIVAGGPPPALYRLFEDESYFTSLLNEGEGKISLEPADRYVGQASLKVTPDQRFRAKMPGLGVKIAENPGDGEYRYLRFAWRKKGGSNILLQFHANGEWGPPKGDPKPSYRYEAGPTVNPFGAAAISLSPQLPEEWTVVTRDLFADFGAFSMDGLALSPSDGEYALFDHFYLARTEADLQGCPAPPPPEAPLAVFEDQPEFPGNLLEGSGSASLFMDEKYSGTASVKVTPDQKFNAKLPGLGVNIRQNPGPGEYRYLRFAWKKQGGQRICLQLANEGVFGPSASTPGKLRYDAGPGEGESYGAALRLDANLPAGFVVVTRDLFADFGEFRLTGLGLSPVDGEFALFDHIYLGHAPRDFELVAPK